MNRYKSQLVKVEKENENKHIRRKISTHRKETVWERLSKVRKSASSEHTAVNYSTTYNTMLNTKSNHRLSGNPRNSAACPSAAPNYSTQVSGKANVRPLTPNSAFNKRPSSVDKRVNRKVKSTKTTYDSVVVEEIPLCRPVRTVRPVKELLTARSICNSKSSSGESKDIEDPKAKRATSSQTEKISARRSPTKQSNYQISNQTICNLRLYANAESSRSGISSSHYFDPTAVIHPDASETLTPGHRLGLTYRSDTNRGVNFDNKNSGEDLYANASGYKSLVSQPNSIPNSRRGSPTKTVPNRSQSNSNRNDPNNSNNNNSPLHNNTPHNSPPNSPRHNNKSPHNSPPNSPHHNNSPPNSPYNSCHNNPSSDKNSRIYTGASNNLSQQRCTQSQDSMDLYEMPPLIPVPTRESLNTSASLEKNIKSLLESKQHTISPSEFKLIKRIIKSDGRYRQLHQMDERLCKDILKTQLQDILKQGLVVKSTLRKLNSTESDVELPSTPCIEKSLAYSETLTDKQQVDVIFKNVPTLEKEIVILRALGEKLEATLKRTTSRRSLHICERRSTSTSMAIRMELRHVCCILRLQHYAKVCVHPMGVRCCLGVIKEYHIAHKTIVELKEEANRHFYLPLYGDRSELKRTSFKKLKQHPDILMRFLKPKSALVPFNILEQDPMFFNSFILNMTALPRSGRDNLPGPGCEGAVLYEAANEMLNQPKQGLREGGDYAPHSWVSLIAEHSEDDSNGVPMEDCGGANDWSAGGEVNGVIRAAVSSGSGKTVGTEPPQSATHKPVREEPSTNPKPRVTFSDAVSDRENSGDVERKGRERFVEKVAKVRGKQGRRWHRSVTPMPLNKYAEPKNNLLKTILVGSLQISVFLLLIMAITYPELKC